MNSVPTSFWEWLARLPQEEMMGVLLIGVLAVLGTTMIVCVTIYSVHKNRIGDALKRELLERGMSADEIATVISAKPPRTGLRGLRPL